MFQWVDWVILLHFLSRKSYMAMDNFQSGYTYSHVWASAGMAKSKEALL